MSTLPILNPVEPFLRTDRMPHIWCPGCGIGTTVNCFARALVESKLPLEKVRPFEDGLLTFLRAKNPDILEAIRSSGDLPNDVEAKLKAAVEAYAATFT